MSNSITENIKFIKLKLANTNTKLIAVTKTKPISLLLEAYNLGLNTFGENKVQEMAEKHEAMPKDINWHLIGHLQTNKVKYIAPFVALIHSVDSVKLLEEINKQALKNHRVIDCLLQVYIATEDTKFGLSEVELAEILESDLLKTFLNIKIVGLMGMASNTENEAIIKTEFDRLKTLFEILKQKYNTQNIELKELSMGMSGDFELAIASGSTMVRVGSAIFGSR